MEKVFFNILRSNPIYLNLSFYDREIVFYYYYFGFAIIFIKND